ncbi:hypothetical protein AcW2_006158 [Taiwanofungus camphoratus]|nr:hypothetical protein AcW2_006158 [Antrodia cinnamomea]
MSPPNVRPTLRTRGNTLQKSLNNIETDSAHHLAGPFRPQTPLNSTFSEPSSPVTYGVDGKSMGKDTGKEGPWSTSSHGLWADIKSARWVVVPSSSFKLLLIPIVLWTNWEVLAPYVAKGLPNPFAPLLFISHRLPGWPDDDPRYRKGYLDFVFIAYYIVVWSFVRQIITLRLCRPVARYFGIKREAKLARFGEQGYALVYFAFMGLWGVHIMSKLPTWWYRTEYFWIDYPHWEMRSDLKSYYLMQAAYWCQQLIVLVMKLEKPRKDFNELVAHHLVTLWLIGWSYLVNLTLIGNAVYVSMDIPDTFLAFSKLLNYIQYDNAKIVAFMALFVVWTYFRHWQNIVILYSVWTQFDLIPESSKRLKPFEGLWMEWWMKYQIFMPILLLQFLNLFWYFLILRIAKR